MKRLFVPTIFAGLLFQAIPALADSSATATIDWGSFNVQIIDLNLLDGITPMFTWTSQSGGANTSTSSYADGGSDTAASTRNANNWTKVLSANSSTPNAQASAQRNLTSLSATSTTQSSITDDPNVMGSNSASASAVNSGYFSLTGAGIALITLNWSAGVNTQNSDWNNNSTANVSISGNYSDGLYTNGSASSGVNLYSWWGGPQSAASTFALAVTNTGVGTTTGNFNANISTSSTSPVTYGVITEAVPEPETYAMLLAGLGLIGFMVRRRKF